jgi:hypothetical protein
MPADPIRLDQLGGEQRFRADLVAYLDSLPVGELEELPSSRSSWVCCLRADPLTAGPLR